MHLNTSKPLSLLTIQAGSPVGIMHCTLHPATRSFLLGQVFVFFSERWSNFLINLFRPAFISRILHKWLIWHV